MTIPIMLNFGPAAATTTIAKIMGIIPACSIHMSGVMYAEPLRKKKVVNPLITKKQFERKVRRLEREIAKLESIPPKLKPILEYQLPPHVVKEMDQRIRDHNDNTCHKLMNQYYKVWAIYKGIESQEEMRWIESVVRSQETALKILRKEYPDLYEKAVQIDPDFIPFKIENVRKHTAPNESYKCPDGRETDTTKQWRL